MERMWCYRTNFTNKVNLIRRVNLDIYSAGVETNPFVEDRNRLFDIRGFVRYICITHTQYGWYR